LTPWRGGRPSEGSRRLNSVGGKLSPAAEPPVSAHRTPDTPVADAIAASICLPVIFEPWSIGGELHVDGGIVSNLPAWPFDEERELDPEALTIAIEIATDAPAEQLNRFNWPSAAIQTGLFGSGELNLRVSGQAERLLLSSSLDVLEFDLDRPRIRQEVLDAGRAASVRLDKRLFRLPQLYRDACGVTQGLVDDVISTVARATKGRTRVALALPDRDYHRSLRLRYSTGYADDHDEALLLPVDGSLAGKAWLAKQSHFEVAPLPAAINLSGPANRLRRKAQWSDLAWMLCIPIFESSNNEPRLVVQIDGSGRLPRSRAVAAAVTEIERDVTDFFNLIIRELAELEDDNGLAEHEFSQAGDAA
jgi:NTE family protein